jgi:glutathione peroxidase
MNSVFDIPITALDGSPDLLANLRGQVLLLVNVASRCGLTPQYTGLEELQRELQEHGFSVVGFPCNQFGAQEPGTAQEIQQFCNTQYAVSFPLSSKIIVNGVDRHPVYQYLLAGDPGNSGDITWNFEKFLVARNGNVLKRYPPQTSPQDKQLLQDIAEALSSDAT